MFVSCGIRSHGWLAVFLFSIPGCYSQYSLRMDLTEAGIPVTTFSKAELDELVDGTGASKNPYDYFVYVRRDGDSLTGLPRLVRYDENTGEIIRSELQLKKDDPYCCGSPDGIKILDDYLLLYFHYNPSASVILVLDNSLRLKRSLDGFDLQKVAPNQIVLTENMVHFAPTHPERLQWVDLSKDIDLEIYPLKNDTLRNRFIHDFVKHMPIACKQSDQLCDYGLIEEGCVYLGGNGRTEIAYDCGRSANYQAKKGNESTPYFTDSAVYLYAHNSKGWVYCAQPISEGESAALDKEGTKGYEKIKSRCTPKLAVIPDNDR